MLKDLLNLLNVLATPTDVFASLKERPRWVVAFVVITVVSIAIAWLMIPFSQQIALVALSGRLSAERLHQALAMAGRFRYIGFAAVPFTLLIKWAVVAAILFLLCYLLEAPNELKYRKFFSVVAFSGVILLFMSIVNVLILYLKGVGAVQSVADLAPTDVYAGLGFLVKANGKNLPLYSLLSNINVFAIWYIITLTVGVSVLTGYRKLKSAGIVTAVWFLGVVLQVVMAFIAGNSPFGKGM